MKTVSASLKTELESGAPVLATCWKVERTDGTILGFTTWPDSFDYLGLTYNSAGGYRRTAIDTKDGLAVDNSDIVGMIDSAYITTTDLMAGYYRGAKVWIFAVSPNNLAWGDIKLDYGVIGEVHVGEIHFVAEFRSLVTKLSQEFGDKFSRYCRHKLGSSQIVNGTEQKCGVKLEPDPWSAFTQYAVGDVVAPLFYADGLQFVCTDPGVSAGEPNPLYTRVMGTLRAHWRLGDLADANWTSVSLLLHCNGTDGSTTITDTSSNGLSPTVSGNAQLDTAEQKFGTASLLLDGDGDCISYATNAVFGFGTGSWTVEFWIRRDKATTAIARLFDFRTAASQDGTIQLSAAGKIEYYDGATTYTETVVDAGQTHRFVWHHVAMVHDGSGGLKGFLDGVLFMDRTGLSIDFGASRPLRIGADYSAVTTSEFEGWIDEVRVTKGVARYSAAFKPQAREWHNATTNTTAVDETGTYDGTYSGGPTLGEDGLQGLDGDKAVSFAAATEYVDLIAGRAAFEVAIWSVEIWFSTSAGSTYRSLLVAYPQNYQADARGMSIQMDPNGAIIFVYGISGDSSYKQLTSTTDSFDDGNPHVVHLVFGGSGNPVELYVDGNLEDSGTCAGDVHWTDAGFGNAAEYKLGVAQLAASPFPGTLDECSVIGAALTKAQIDERIAWAAFTPPGEPDWNETLNGSTVDGSVEWKTVTSLMKQGAVTAVTSDYKFTDTSRTEADDWFQYGVLTWLTGDNAGRSQDVKESTALGVITLRQEATKPIQIGDTYKMHAGCNHILKMPADTIGTAYTGDCRAKFDNVKNYGGEPELPNIDRISTPASNVT